MKRLDERLKEEIDKHGVELTADDSKVLSQLTADLSQQVEKQFPEGSFQRIFWEQQMQHLRLKDKRAMRWHPAIIKFALNLKNRRIPDISEVAWCARS